MNQSYVETIEKVQAQGLQALRNIPTIVSQVSELNSAFAVKLIEQQNDYVNQLVNLLKSAQTETTTTEGVAGKA